MYFYNLMKKISKNKKISLFIDMDGVIASYNFGEPLNFKTKRPLKSTIRVLEKVSQLKNIDLYILSICRKDYEINDKNNWLDQHAPFFKKNHRYILSKETIPNQTSGEMKALFLKYYPSKNQKVLVDDDNSILKEIKEEVKDIILFQDSELVD